MTVSFLVQAAPTDRTAPGGTWVEDTGTPTPPLPGASLAISTEEILR